MDYSKIEVPFMDFFVTYENEPQLDEHVSWAKYAKEQLLDSLESTSFEMYWNLYSDDLYEDEDQFNEFLLGCVNKYKEIYHLDISLIYSDFNGLLKMIKYLNIDMYKLLSKIIMKNEIIEYNHKIMNLFYNDINNIEFKVLIEMFSKDDLEIIIKNKFHQSLISYMEDNDNEYMEK